MRRNSITLAAGTLLASLCFAQSTHSQEGAKALFINSLTNEQEMPRQEVSKRSLDKPGTAAANRKVPAVTGVMFYVELLRPSGEVMRVNSDRVFHTGDRIRLHLNSNVNGTLVIYQSEDGSKPELLFPSGKLSGRVAKESDVVLPSSHAWFRFDDHPGQIRLTLKLTAEDNAVSNQNAASKEESRPLIADADSVHDLHEAQSGSKALKIETDDSPAGASEVVVMDSRQDHATPPGQIAVEITLTHRA